MISQTASNTTAKKTAKMFEEDHARCFICQAPCKEYVHPRFSFGCVLTSQV